LNITLEIGVWSVLSEIYPLDRRFHGKQSVNRCITTLWWFATLVGMNICAMMSVFNKQS